MLKFSGEFGQYSSSVRWLGHTLRHGNLLPLIIEGRVEGRRPPGRPRTGMLDRIKKATLINV